jgi:hypothetical protein
VYATLVDNLKVEEDEDPEKVRKKIDRELLVGRWGTPAVQPKPRDSSIPDNAPVWWDGEEEASSSFLAAMGVDLGAAG